MYVSRTQRACKSRSSRCVNNHEADLVVERRPNTSRKRPAKMRQLMVFFPCVFPLLLLPLIVGVYLFGRPASSPLIHFMALMTLKPVLATPLWLVMIELSVTTARTPPIPEIVLQALPGISLTLLIVWTCRARLRGQPADIITTLLILDTLRWGSSVLSQTVYQISNASGLLFLSGI